MPNPHATPDFEALAVALAEGAALEQIGEALGVQIDAPGRSALLEFASRRLSSPRALGLPLMLLLSLLYEALHRDDPFLFFQKKRRFFHQNVLIAKWSSGGEPRVTLGAADGGVEFVKLWHSFNNTNQKKADYEARLMEWAQREPPDAQSIVFRVRPRRASPQATRSEEELLREVAANPEDQELRQVLTDIWMARGDPRGQLVALQAELEACTDWDHKRRESSEKIDALYDTWLPVWAGPAAPYVDRACMNRGFIDRVRMSPQDFVKHAAEVFALHPIRQLDVLRTDESGQQFRKMVACPELARIRALHITKGPSASRRSVMAIAHLGAFQQLDRLEELHLSNVGRDAADWEVGLGTVKLPALRRLKLGGCGFGPALYRVLGDNPSFHRIESLTDRWIDAKSGDFASTVASFGRALVALKELVLERGPWTDDAIAGFFEHRQARIRAIELSGTQATAGVVDRLARTPSAKSLGRFVVYDAPVSPVAAERLIDSSTFPALEEMSFTGGLEGWSAEFCRDLMRRLVALPLAHPLKKVSLRRVNELDPELEVQFKARFASAS
ncbi:MAG: hypothetical protein U0271_17720 [Polyangiaceae bacterium]